VPSFGQHRQTLRLWAELPGLERAGSGAALTFDDGPDPDATPAVLDALDAAGASATFFMVGEQVEAHPELAREVAARGHDVQLHCFHHREHADLEDPGADVDRALAAIERATGVRARLQRPPYGRFSARSHEACLRAGLEPVYWSAWGEDWEALEPDRIADLVARDLEPGVVILLHDSARYAHRPSARPTAQAIPLISQAAARASIELGSLSDAARQA
jgi:peptidoglycan/xylan/chitin deacetylase (PgdA/CDA1 family)